MSDPRDDAATTDSPAPATAESGTPEAAPEPTPAEVADTAADATADETAAALAEQAADTAADAGDVAVDAESEAVAERADEVAEVTVGGRGATLDDAPVTADDGTLVAESAADRAAEEAASPEAPIGEREGVLPFVDEAATEAAAEAPPVAAAPAAEKPAEPESAELLALRDAMEKNEAVEGQVIGWNKGGYHVALGRIAAFCPVSQIEIGNPRAPKKYLDRSFQFQVLEVQAGGRRVVVSRAAALKAEREARAREVKERFHPGAEVEGKVSSLTDFGAFVDLGGGIEGLVHVSEISRRRVEHPKEMLTVGQEVKVAVLKVEKRGQRISLSMKRLEKDPWEGVGERFASGDTFAGTILRKTDFGLFVEVEPGLEGLIHLSRLPLGATLESDGLEVGSRVEGWIHDVDAKRRRLSLSLREVAQGNPWQSIGERYPVGSVVDGTVERLAPFGAFIELEPGVTGLLPFSAVSSEAPGSNPKRQYHVGRGVKVKVMSVDRGRKRISLGTEQSKAEGSEADYREYLKSQKQQSSSGLGTLAAAFEKLKSQAEAES